MSPCAVLAAFTIRYKSLPLSVEFEEIWSLFWIDSSLVRLVLVLDWIMASSGLGLDNYSLDHDSASYACKFKRCKHGNSWTNADHNMIRKDLG